MRVRDEKEKVKQYKNKYQLKNSDYFYNSKIISNNLLQEDSCEVSFHKQKYFI